jgi:hypothetical protein
MRKRDIKSTLKEEDKGTIELQVNIPDSPIQLQDEA